MKLRGLPVLLPIALGFVLVTTACTSNSRGTTPLEYAGDPSFAVTSVEHELVRRGYKPTCKKEQFCRFVFEDRLDLHFKAAKGGLVLIVDVVDGKKMSPADEAKLRAEGERLGNEIFAAARVEAIAAEKNAQQVAALEEEEERRRDAEEAKNRPPASPGFPAIPGFPGGNGGVTVGAPTNGGAAPGGGETSSELSCCLNGQFFSCPTFGAVKQCAGDTAACLMGCQSDASPSACEDRCLAEHRPDPSACSREPSRDASCR